MTRSQTAVGVVLVLLLGVGCASRTAGTAVPQTPVGPAQPPPAATTAAPAPPPEPTPADEAPCPYLEDDVVEQTNGQRVGRTEISADDPPACFFYRSDGNEQLRVRVLVGADPATARALVDRAAPVDTSDPATLPGGWEGGKQPTDDGAVFAVAKDGVAVVVVGNQQQTIKVGRIAEQVIVALRL